MEEVEDKVPEGPSSSKPDSAQSGLGTTFKTLQRLNVNVETPDADPVFEVSDELEGFEREFTEYQFEDTADSSSSQEDPVQETSSSSTEQWFQDWNGANEDAISQHTHPWPSFHTSHPFPYEQEFSVERPGPSRQHGQSKTCYSAENVSPDPNVPALEAIDSGFFFGTTEGPSPEAGRSKSMEGQTLGTYFMGVGEPGPSTMKERVLVIVTPPSDPKLYNEDASEGSRSQKEASDDVSREDFAKDSSSRDEKILEKTSCNVGNALYSYQEDDGFEMDLQGSEASEDERTSNEALDKLEGRGKAQRTHSKNSPVINSGGNNETEFKQKLKSVEHGHFKDKVENETVVELNKRNENETEIEQELMSDDHGHPNSEDQRQNKMAADVTNSPGTQEVTHKVSVDESIKDVQENQLQPETDLEMQAPLKHEEQGSSRRRFNQVLFELSKKMTVDSRNRFPSAENKNQSGLRETGKGRWQKVDGRDSASETLSFPFASGQSRKDFKESAKFASDSSLTNSSDAEQKSPVVPVPRKRSFIPLVGNASQQNKGSITKKMVALFSNTPLERLSTKAEQDNSRVSSLIENSEDAETLLRNARSTSVDLSVSGNLIKKQNSEMMHEKTEDEMESAHHSTNLGKTKTLKVEKNKTEPVSVRNEPDTTCRKAPSPKTFRQTSPDRRCKEFVDATVSRQRDVTNSVAHPRNEGRDLAGQCHEEPTEVGSSKNPTAQSVEAILLVLESMQNVLTKMSAMSDPVHGDSSSENAGGLKHPTVRKTKKTVHFKGIGRRKEESPPGGLYAYNIAHQIVGQAVRKIGELYPDCQQRVLQRVGNSGTLTEDSPSLILALTAMREVLHDLDGNSSLSVEVQTSESITASEAPTVSCEATLDTKVSKSDDYKEEDLASKTLQSTETQTSDSLTALEAPTTCPDVAVNVEHPQCNQCREQHQPEKLLLCTGVQTSPSLTALQVPTPSSEAALNTVPSEKDQCKERETSSKTLLGTGVHALIPQAALETPAASQEISAERQASIHYDSVLRTLSKEVESEMCSGANAEIVPSPASEQKHSSATSVTSEHLQVFTDDMLKRLSYELVARAIDMAVEALADKQGASRVTSQTSATLSEQCLETVDGDRSPETASERAKEVLDNLPRRPSDLGYPPTEKEFMGTISDEVYSVVGRIFEHLLAERQIAVNVTANARRVPSSSVDGACTVASSTAIPGCSGGNDPDMTTCSTKPENTPEISRAVLSAAVGCKGENDKEKDEKESPADVLQRKQREHLAAKLFSQKSPTADSSSPQATAPMTDAQQGPQQGKSKERSSKTDGNATVVSEREKKKSVCPSPDKSTAHPSPSSSSHDDTDSSMERLFSNHPTLFSASFGFSEHSMSRHAITAESSNVATSDMSLMRAHQLDIDRHWGSPAHSPTYPDHANSLRLVANGGVVMHGGNHPEHVRQVDRQLPTCSGTPTVQSKHGDEFAAPMREQLTSKSLTTNVATKQNQASAVVSTIPQPLQRMSKPLGNKTARRFHSFSEPRLDFYSRTEELECRRPRQRLLDVPEHSSDWSITGYYPPQAQPIYVITNSDSSSSDNDTRSSDLYEVEFEARLQQNEIDVVLDIVANYQHVHRRGPRPRGGGPAGFLKPPVDSDYSSGAVDESGPRSPASSDRRSRNSSTQTSSSARSCTCKTLVTCRCKSFSEMQPGPAAGSGQAICGCCPSTSSPSSRPPCTCSGHGPSDGYGGQRAGGFPPAGTITTRRSRTSSLEWTEERRVEAAPCLCPHEATNELKEWICSKPSTHSASVDPDGGAAWQPYCEDSHHQCHQVPSLRQNLLPLRARSLDKTRSHLCDLHDVRSRTEIWTPGAWTDRELWCEACKHRRAVSDTPVELCRHMSEFQVEVARSVKEIRSAMAGLCSLVRCEHAQGEQTRKKLEDLTRQLTPPRLQTGQPRIGDSSRVDPGSSLNPSVASSLGREGCSLFPAQRVQSWCVDDVSISQGAMDLVRSASDSLSGISAVYEDSSEPCTSYKYCKSAAPCKKYATPQSSTTSGRDSHSSLPGQKCRAAAVTKEPPAAPVKKDVGRSKNRSVAPTPQRSPLDSNPPVLRPPTGPNAVNLSGRNGAFYSVKPASARDCPASSEAEEVSSPQRHVGSKERFLSNSNRSAVHYEQREPFAVGDCSLPQESDVSEQRADTYEGGDSFETMAKLFQTELGVMAGMAFGGAHAVGPGTQQGTAYSCSMDGNGSGKVSPGEENLSSPLSSPDSAIVSSSGDAEKKDRYVVTDTTCSEALFQAGGQSPEKSPRKCRLRKDLNYVSKFTESDLRDILVAGTSSGRMNDVSDSPPYFDAVDYGYSNEVTRASPEYAAKTPSNAYILDNESLRLNTEDTENNNVTAVVSPDRHVPRSIFITEDESCERNMDFSGNDQISSEAEAAKRVVSSLMVEPPGMEDANAEALFQSSLLIDDGGSSEFSSYQVCDVLVPDEKEEAAVTGVTSDHSRLSVSSSDSSLPTLCPSFHTARNELDGRLQTIEEALDILEEQLSASQSKQLQRSPTFMERLRSVEQLLQNVEKQVVMCHQYIQQEQQQQEPGAEESCLSLEQDLLQSFGKRLQNLIMQQQGHQLPSIPETDQGCFTEQDAVEDELDGDVTSTPVPSARSLAEKEPEAGNSHESVPGRTPSKEQSLEDAENGNTVSQAQQHVHAAATLRTLEQVLLTLAEQLASANIEQFQQEEVHSTDASSPLSDTRQQSLSSIGERLSPAFSSQQSLVSDVVCSQSVEQVLQGLVDRLASPRVQRRQQHASAESGSSLASSDQTLSQSEKGSVAAGFVQTELASSTASLSSGVSLGARIQLRCEAPDPPQNRTPSALTCNVNTNTNHTTNRTTANSADLSQRGAAAAAASRDVGVNTSFEVPSSERDPGSCDVHRTLSSVSQDVSHRTESSSITAPHPLGDRQSSLMRYQQRVRSLERELRAEKDLHGITRSSLQTLERDHINLRLQIASLRQKRVKRDKNIRLKEILARAQVWNEKFDENS